MFTFKTVFAGYLLYMILWHLQLMFRLTSANISWNTPKFCRAKIVQTTVLNMNGLWWITLSFYITTVTQYFPKLPWVLVECKLDSVANLEMSTELGLRSFGLIGFQSKFWQKGHAYGKILVLIAYMTDIHL